MRCGPICSGIRDLSLAKAHRLQPVGFMAGDSGRTNVPVLRGGGGEAQMAVADAVAFGLQTD